MVHYHYIFLYFSSPVSSKHRKAAEKLRKESIVNELLNEEKRRKQQNLIEIFRTKQDEEHQVTIGNKWLSVAT